MQSIFLCYPNSPFCPYTTSKGHDMGAGMGFESDPYLNWTLYLVASEFKMKAKVLLQLVYREQGPWMNCLYVVLLILCYNLTYIIKFMWFMLVDTSSMNAQ